MTTPAHPQLPLFNRRPQLRAFLIFIGIVCIFFGVSMSSIAHHSARERRSTDIADAVNSKEAKEQLRGSGTDTALALAAMRATLAANEIAREADRGAWRGQMVTYFGGIVLAWTAVLSGPHRWPWLRAQHPVKSEPVTAP